MDENGITLGWERSSTWNWIEVKKKKTRNSLSIQIIQYTGGMTKQKRQAI